MYVNGCYSFCIKNTNNHFKYVFFSIYITYSLQDHFIKEGCVRTSLISGGTRFTSVYTTNKNRFIRFMELSQPFFFFLKVFGGHMSFLGPLVPLFWISGDVSSGVQSQSGFCLIHFFVEVNVMYIPQDPPLVLRISISWWLAVQPVTSPHASAEVGLGSDSNGQSPGQKTIALPLCH